MYGCVCVCMWAYEPGMPTVNSWRHTHARLYVRPWYEQRGKRNGKATSCNVLLICSRALFPSLNLFSGLSLSPPPYHLFSICSWSVRNLQEKRWMKLHLLCFSLRSQISFFFRQLVKTGFLHCPLRQIELGLRQLRRVKPDQNFRIVLGKAKQRGVTIGYECKLILVPGSVRLSTEVQGQRQVGD